MSLMQVCVCVVCVLYKTVCVCVVCVLYNTMRVHNTTVNECRRYVRLYEHGLRQYSYFL